MAKQTNKKPAAKTTPNKNAAPKKATSKKKYYKRPANKKTSSKKPIAKKQVTKKQVTKKVDFAKITDGSSNTIQKTQDLRPVKTPTIVAPSNFWGILKAKWFGFWGRGY